MNTLFEHLLWVDPFWGRYNMGAIEFSNPFFILVDFRALSAVICTYMRISYWDLNEFDHEFENIAEKRASYPICFRSSLTKTDRFR